MSDSAEYIQLCSFELAKCLTQLLDRDRLEPRQVAVLMPGSLMTPQSNCQSEAHAMHALTLEQLLGPSQGVVAQAQIGKVISNCLYWGAAENFAGLERAAVVVTGFHHPRYLVERHVNQHFVAPLARHTLFGGSSAVDPVAYLALTRSKYRIEIVDTLPLHFLSHYQVRHVNSQRQVPHSSGLHTALLVGPKLALECTINFGLETLPERLGTKTVVNLEGLTVEHWELHQLESLGQRMPNVLKLNVTMGACWRLQQACKLHYVDSAAKSPAIAESHLLHRDEMVDAMEMLESVFLDAGLWSHVLLSKMQLGGLKMLQELDLSANGLVNMDEEIWLLTGLKILCLHRNHLKSVPETFGNLSNLQTLRLDENKLESIPETVGKLTNLRELNLQRNQLVSVPETIGKLTNLVVLLLYENKLESIPETVGDMAKLTYLNMFHNQLQTVPESIGNLNELQRLFLDSNKLQTVPKTLGRLANLQRLNLHCNELESIPETIGNLKNLRTLRLDRNKLKSIPETIGDLTNLRELSLSKNPLEIIPETIGKLTDLRKLYLDQTKLASMPGSIGKLTNLQSISLYHDELESISLPEPVQQIKDIIVEPIFGDLTSNPGLKSHLASLEAVLHQWKKERSMIAQ
jgi:Leucine-rich repeat (LRR) protein